MSVTAYIALGSNLGDRQDNLEQAVARLEATLGVAVVRRSSSYETEPIGGPAHQLKYLNAAVEIVTSLSPAELLARCQVIETELGRVRAEKDGPRTIDLDILLYGEAVVEEPTLVIPHPRLHQRLFVLAPLEEIAAGAIHPLLNRTVGRLRADLTGVAPAGARAGRELAGLRALVTGSSSGIGKAVALELAAAGADVAVHGRRSREALEAVAAAVKRLGGRSGAVLADLSQGDSLMRFVQNVWMAWDGLDILINNAGADTLTGEAAKWPFERKLDELLAVDLKATMFLSREIGSRMKQAGGGVIINVGWDQAETGMAGDSGELFAAVKGAIMCFSRSLALSLAPEVRVHCVAPGWIKTSWGESASEPLQERVRRETPLGVWGRPEDVAAAVRWLVAPQARYMTGQVIRVNGGAVR